jgi:Flp pilus assembly pilin Flp
MTVQTKAHRAHESGATAVEYALVASLIAVAVVIVMNTMTIGLTRSLGKVNFESGNAFEVSEPK